jgi:hypothetical protein
VIVRRVPITQIAIDIAIRFSRGLSHKKKKWTGKVKHTWSSESPRTLAGRFSIALLAS